MVFAQLGMYKFPMFEFLIIGRDIELPTVDGPLRSIDRVVYFVFVKFVRFSLILTSSYWFGWFCEDGFLGFEDLR